MQKKEFSKGFTLLEVLMSVFIMSVILVSTFVLLGALSEKTDILLAEAELRGRSRAVEAKLRLDLENAVPTSELEFYAERDGVPGPRFNPEPLADYGSDGLPNGAERGHRNLINAPLPDADGCQDTFNPDPHGDDDYILNWKGYRNSCTGKGCTPPGGLTCPVNIPQKVFDAEGGTDADAYVAGYDNTEGNGILDPGEWLLDIDGNGRFTGEPFLTVVGGVPIFGDTAIDQFNQIHDGSGGLSDWTANTVVSPNANWIRDMDNQVRNVSGLTETVSGRNIATGWGIYREDHTELDGDGIFSPMDSFIIDPRQFRSDRTPPQDNPNTLMVDESPEWWDGTGLLDPAAFVNGAVDGGNAALAYHYLSTNFVPLSPYGFLDSNWLGTAVGLNAFTLNNRFDPEELPYYDYFAGIVNTGDQDSLYFRTQVSIAGELREANVYYRLYFVNFNNNYSDTWNDTVGYTDPAGNAGLGINDGIWTPGEPILVDNNGNGWVDPIVDPGEIRLQRVISLPGNPEAQVEDLGPATRFNVEYYDQALDRFAAPFTDSGIDGISDPEEIWNPGGPGNGYQPTFGCPDPNGDNFHPDMNPTGTENNGILDLVNSSGIPAGTLNINPFLQGANPGAYQIGSGPWDFAFPSGAPAFPGENPYVGIKKFGYPESAGSMVYQVSFTLIPLVGKDPLPPVRWLDWLSLEAMLVGPGQDYGLLFPNQINNCDNGYNSAEGTRCDSSVIYGCPDPNGAGVPPLPPAVFWQRAFAGRVGTNNFYRYAPAGVFDEEGWLRCSGIRDNFAHLRPGDKMFVWAFYIPPPQTGTDSPGAEPVRVPVPPGYYPIQEIRGHRVKLDLSTVRGGAPSPDQLSGVPAVFRAGYLPPAFRIQITMLSEQATGVRPAPSFTPRALRIWEMYGPSVDPAGMATQALPINVPTHETVMVVAPNRIE